MDNSLAALTMMKPFRNVPNQLEPVSDSYVKRFRRSCCGLSKTQSDQMHAGADPLKELLEKYELIFNETLKNQSYEKFFLTVLVDLTHKM